MKKTKILALVLSILLIASGLLAIPASAASDAYDTLSEALGGKKALMFPGYITGGDGFQESEGSASLFVYDEAEDNGDFPKYCTNQSPYWAEWKYDKAYKAERIILRTANDNEQYPRRMGNGWTLSGSNDGKEWTVIYTGSEDDVINTNFQYYYVDLPDNSAEYEYYKLNSDDAASDQEEFVIQLSMLILAVDQSAETPAAAPWIPKEHRVGATKATIKAVDFDPAVYGKSGNPDDGSKIIRPDEDVNTEPGENKALEFGGNIGWIAAGDWVQYTVEFTRDGVFSFDAWLATDNDGLTEGVKIYVDDKEVGVSAGPAKGGWQAYELYPVGEAEITAGSNIVKIEFMAGLNFTAFEVSRTGDIPGSEPEAPAAAPEGEDAAQENAAAGDANETAPAAADDKDGTSPVSPVMLIIIGAAVLLVVIIIVVLATRKKK